MAHPFAVISRKGGLPFLARAAGRVTFPLMPHASISWHDILRFWHGWIYLLKWPIAFVAGWAGIHYQRWRKLRPQGEPCVRERPT